MRLTLIGYWKGPYAQEWPEPQRFVDPTWDTEERDFVVAHLKYGIVAGACMGFSNCRFCGIKNGNLELTDGVYVWPEGLAHYLVDHAVRLPPEFVDHIYKMRNELHESTVDEEWWRGCRTLG